MLSIIKLTTFSFSIIPALAIAVPRSSPPPTWSTSTLEPYDTYHPRYLALSCHTKHDTDFFEQCCHPLLRDETLASRLPRCSPSPTDSDISVGTPVPAAEEASEDLELCDRETTDNDEEVSAPASSETPQDTPDETSESDKVNADSSSSSAKTAAKTVYNGGFATYYYQNGVAGACGKVHTDRELIAAIDGDRYGSLGAVSSLCGRQVRITNTKNNKAVTVIIADACPTCRNSNSIDLSETAFQRIAPLEEGIVPISWSFV